MDEKRTIEVQSTLSLNEAQQARIRAVSKQIKLHVTSTREAGDIPREQWDRIEILLSNGQMLPAREQVPSLNWMQLTYAGLDKAANHPLVSDKSLLITSASGTMVSQMGEYVLMALLALGHRLPETIRLQKAKKWSANTDRTLTPQELRGSTVGIVGYGSIGREVARLLHSFGGNVLAAKKDAMRPEDSGYTPEGLGDPQGNYFQRLYPIEGLRGMLEECDFVVISLPLTAETRHLLSTAEFEAMKPGVGLVNVARGAVIDEAALEAALRSGKVGGAVLDVFETEPLPEDSPLWSLPNVIVTPHVSAYSGAYMDAIVDLFVENLKRYLAGDTLLNTVDLDKGY